MSSISKIYFVFKTQNHSWSHEGLDPALFEIWVGDAGRQWLEVHYIDKNIRPMENITRFVPEKPGFNLSLIDACVLFYPSYFRGCPSINMVRKAVQAEAKGDFLDLDNAGEDFLAQWKALRAEAVKEMSGLQVCLAEFKPVTDFHTDSE
jgi:hypothetical protein